MRVLITGASGFIGGHVARRLMEELSADDNDVVLTDYRLPKYRYDAVFHLADIRSREHLNFIKGFDVIIHCAGILGTETTFDHIVQTEMVNTVGTLNVLERANGAVVYQPGLLGNWLNPYMISKRATEEYGFMARKYLGIRYVSVRFTDVYGPGQATDQKKITPTFIRKAIYDEPIPVYGDGSYKVRMLYIDDAAEVLVQLALREVYYQATVDITSLNPENFISVKDYAEMIIELSDSQSEIEYKPMRIGQPDDYPHADPDIAQSGRMFDLLEIHETPLRDGLKATIEYYRRLEKPEWGI